ncbi:MAG TPA: Na+ dependent nucleoside transporter N-terminal domain-containing protein, partial [Rhizomicrobium sp.]
MLSQFQSLLGSSGGVLSHFQASLQSLFGAGVLPHFQSLLGIAVILLIAWIISENRRGFPFRTVISGIVLQITLALLLLK